MAKRILIRCIIPPALIQTAPIIARHGRKTLGVTVNAYSVSALNEITTNRIGMGATGEVYHEISRFARNDSHRKIASG